MTADGSRTATSADRPTPRASQCAVSSKRSRKAYVATRRPRASHARSGAGPSSGRCPWGSAGSGSPASAASGSGPSRAGAEEAHEDARRHDDGEHARDGEAEQQEERGFLEAGPGLPAELEEEVGHRAVSACCGSRGPAGARPIPGTVVTDTSRYRGRYL